MAGKSPGLNDGTAFPIDVADGDSGRVNALNAEHVDAENVHVRAPPMTGVDAARRAEIVAGLAGIPLIQAQTLLALHFLDLCMHEPTHSYVACHPR